MCDRIILEICFVIAKVHEYGARESVYHPTSIDFPEPLGLLLSWGNDFFYCLLARMEAPCECP
jgi:hypothetical protein